MRHIENHVFNKESANDFAIAQEIINNKEVGNAIFNKKIYEKYKQEVRNICFGILKDFTKNEQDVEDTVQETFVHVFDKLNQFKGDSPIKFWIIKIAKNTALFFIKKNIVSQRKITSAEPSFFNTNNTFVKHVSEDDKDSPENIFIEKIISEPELLETIFSRAPLMKLIFSLFFLKQMNETEIHEYLKTNLNKSIDKNELRSTKHKAIQSIRKYFMLHRNDYI